MEPLFGLELCAFGATMNDLFERMRSARASQEERFVTAPKERTERRLGVEPRARARSRDRVRR